MTLIYLPTILFSLHSCLLIVKISCDVLSNLLNEISKSDKPINVSVQVFKPFTVFGNNSCLVGQEGVQGKTNRSYLCTMETINDAMILPMSVKH